MREGGHYNDQKLDTIHSFAAQSICEVTKNYLPKDGAHRRCNFDCGLRAVRHRAIRVRALPVHQAKHPYH